MDILSDWKITFDPLGTPFLLVAWGDIIDADPKFPWNQSVQTVDGIDLDDAINYPRGNVAQEFVIGVYKDHATQALKNNYLLERTALIPRSVVAPLQIEVKGGNTYRLSNCVWKGGDNATVPTQKRKARSWIQYRLIGGNWSIVP